VKTEQETEKAIEQSKVELDSLESKPVKPAAKHAAVPKAVEEAAKRPVKPVSDPKEMLLMEDLLDRYLEKVPEGSRQKVVDAMKDETTEDQIKFVKKLLRVGVDLKPAQAAGQLPAPGTPAKPLGFFERGPKLEAVQKQHRWE